LLLTEMQMLLAKINHMGRHLNQRATSGKNPTAKSVRGWNGKTKT